MTLIKLRQRLDMIDCQILTLLSTRQQIIKQVGRLKQATGQKIRQPGREVQILADKNKLANKLRLNRLFVRKLFQLILAESKKAQRREVK